MAQESAIQRRLVGIFEAKLELDIPSAETDLMVTGLMDSLIFVELLFQIEQEFGITVDMESVDLDEFRSIGSIAAYLEQLENGPGQQHAGSDGLTGLVALQPSSGS